MQQTYIQCAWCSKFLFSLYVEGYFIDAKATVDMVIKKSHHREWNLSSVHQKPTQYKLDY